MAKADWKRRRFLNIGCAMRFTKMHGIGNDYIYIDCFSQPAPKDPSALARKLSDRRFAVGGDGVILILPPDSPQHDARMRMFNVDGSEGEMCGNGIRCVAKYVFDHKIAAKKELVIETGGGPLTVGLEIKNAKAVRARVNMSEPIFDPRRIPTTLSGNPPVDVPVHVAGRQVAVTALSMGNPHGVVFVDEPTDDWVLNIGPKLETAEFFPRKANIEFAQVLAPDEIRMRVWERGSGETWACGTGASAVCVAGVLTGRTNRAVTVHLRGGDLDLEWSQADNCVYMTGPATEVCTGEIAPDFLAAE